jgi:hypothetical protein
VIQQTEAICNSVGLSCEVPGEHSVILCNVSCPAAVDMTVVTVHVALSSCQL